MPKPFLTPVFTSEDWQCRTLRTPNNREWLGVFNSALLELLSPYNWEQVNDTDLTIEEAIAMCEEILIEFFATPECTDAGACLQPDGARVIRLNSSGHFEQLANGAWIPPTDDYAVPPVPERTEPTPYDRKCAAAANAANVLKQTYEIVSDGVADGLSEAEISALVAAFLLATIGSWLALAFIALLAVVAALFIAFIEIAQFMTIDLWTAEFDDLLKCLLLECATDDGDVVTFDIACFNDKYAATVDLLSPDALDQLRLFGQVWFMLSVIGADGLNAAGATTAITDANCDDCGGWCYEWDFELTDGDWAQVPPGTSGNYGTYSAGVGWTTTDAIDTIPTPDVYNRMLYVGLDWGTLTTLTHVEIEMEYTKGSFFSVRRALGCEIGENFATTIIDINSTTTLTGTFQLEWDGEQSSDSIVVFMRSSAVTGSPVYSGSCVVKRVLLRGLGDNPFGEDNCE